MASTGDASSADNISTQQNANPTSTGLSTLGPDDMPIAIQFINDNSWLKDFKLNIQKNNWDEWSFQTKVLAGRQGFKKYLDGSFAKPLLDTHAKVHHIWAANDKSLKNFLYSHISHTDYRVVCNLPTAHAIFESLHNTHESLGIHAQMLLIEKALAIRSQPGTPLMTTAEEINTLHERIEAMGPINFDHVRLMFLLHCLSNHHMLVCSHLLNLIEDPTFTSSTILCNFTQHDNFSHHQSIMGVQSSALVAQGQGQERPRSLCTHCKKPGHLADFCVRPGGKMHGRIIDEAHSTQHAASDKPPCADKVSTLSTATAKITSTDTASTQSSSSATQSTRPSVVIGGMTYYPATPTPSSMACVAVSHPPSSILSMELDDSGDSNPYSYHSYLALGGPLTASVDWVRHTTVIDWLATESSPVLSLCACALLSRAIECPFILDSGASHHISPERSDFKELRPIALHLIQGFNGSSTSTIGIGDIDLCIASGHKLVLKDVLFMPSCSTCLVSISALTHTGYNFVTFGTEECWLSDKHHKIIVHRSLSKTSGLYTLNCTSACVARSKSSALYTKRVSDLEIWHCRLSHCNTRSIIDMARSKAVKGMSIDLSSLFPKCDSCVLGKQTQSPVSKTREGMKATKPLERVYVDLCGPMPVTSRSGFSYSMNVIDDYSSYV